MIRSSKMSRNSQILILRYSQTKQIISLFPTVFATLHLPVSLVPIAQLGSVVESSFVNDVYSQ